MKGKNGMAGVLALTAVATVAAGALWQPAVADDPESNITAVSAKPDDSLIDKPFEGALLKHFQKRFFNRIDATDDQRSKLSTILSTRLDATRPLREQIRHELVNLTDLMAKSDATDEQIQDQMKVIKGIRDQLVDERVKTALQVRAVLTPAQRQQISDKIRGFITGDWKPARTIGQLRPGRFLLSHVLGGE